MSKEKELKAFTNGEYVFTKTENDHQFYFYRQDGQELGEVGRIPMDMYQRYICMKMFEGETTEMIANSIIFDTSVDGKCIRLTSIPLDEKISLERHDEKDVKKLKKSFFNKKKR